MSLRDRNLSGGMGGAVAAGVGIAPGPTGTPPGAYRGRGLGEGFGKTDRNDAWWVLPVLQGIGLVCLIGYANYAAIFGAAHYHFIDNGRDYLSPFYSPYLGGFSWRPLWLSPALLVLIWPLGFRTTCYYYRKAYYRSFFHDPIGCAVGEYREKYAGETKFPFILQNIHRYFLYAALVILVILWSDVVRAAMFADHSGHAHFGIGGGTLAILASTFTLTLYTLSCHSLRHLVGGGLDCFSCAVAGGPRQRGWSFLSALNGHHMGYAWMSLFAVCFADAYVRLCSMGILHDPVFFTI